MRKTEFVINGIGLVMGAEQTHVEDVPLIKDNKLEILNINQDVLIFFNTLFVFVST